MSESELNIDWNELEEHWADELDSFESRTAQWDRIKTVLHRLKRHKPAVCGAFVTSLILATAIFAPFVAPYEPSEQDLTNTLAPPSSEHLLGTDAFGRDILSRIIYGSRISLQIAITAVGVALGIGVALGALAGYYGGWIDTAIQTAVDITWSFPAILVGLALAAMLEPSLTNIMVAVGLVFWGQYARLVRGEVLSLREQDFTKAARAIGSSDSRIIIRHLLPNAIMPAFVVATLMMGQAIAAEAALSFLGLGAQPPTPSWGVMLASGRDYMRTAWWISTFPAIAIVVFIFGFNLLGEGLRDALDPKLNR
ncbi:ABC transporter permease [Haloferax volcanii]|uniref:Peptide ABC transporter permease n=4 Tax=Haloferacaceae TaxID=1644056 RepID=A0A384KHB9_HALVD|nr:ABC transporter permease [Haloferax volcanii]ADE01942.1 ABC-type transport system permease protein (probable substrate dipeptide/oligopeptide) [Haloferax volcanii DS2]ELY35864.1 peptide ABC transporter permease [Haloferax volcanii DS2]MBS8121175.1 ABC transporter permease [Haloferax volcanii]MBS8126185.1 ABC transporter permease [Haloferax volcanii]MBS8130054.1 ABC transporter permease [Haloferax volcanii]